MRTFNRILAILLAVVMVLAVVSCTGNNNNTTTTSGNASTTTGGDVDPEAEWDGAYIDEDDFKAYTKHDIEVLVDRISTQLTDDQKTAVEAAKAAGDTAIDAAQTVATVVEAYKNAYNSVLACVPVYEGTQSFVKETNAEKTNILGVLEAYAVANGITGISLFENGNYVMYNPRITLGTENYIVGYGFGVLAEGAITADFDYETNAAWKRYYHTMESSDPGTMNYYNSQDSQVGDLFGYQGASFFTNFMNATKDGYDWVPELAKEKPVAVNDDDGDGAATKWRFEVRTGDADGLKYITGSEMESRKAFNGRGVALEDYETAFKFLLTQSNHLFRGSELANSKSGAIVGAKDFYNGTAEGYKADLWDKVGIKTYVEGGKNYFEVEFAQETTQFYCMYYIASGLYQPLPQEFIDLVTPEFIAGFSKDATQSPVDNLLSLGSYYLERYDADQQIVFKKNPNYVYADTKYSIEGVHIKIFPAAKEDPTATIKEFLAEHFDSCGIPKDYLDDYKNDPRTRSTTGDSNFKLNVNACDAATWETLFGEEGKATQTKKEDYWEVKPVLGNAHFVKAISYSIDRVKFANARGSIPAVDYLSSNYMSDPENGISYSTTDAHKAAVKELLNGTDEGGYSLELARDYFRLAMTELEAAGAYTPGTKENPTVINIEIAWMYPTDEEQYHNEIKNFIETAFNDESVTGGKYKLSVNFWVGNEWSDVYYNKLMLGQYDLGFGSISGNSLDPLDFVSVLSSDLKISNDFTLNWGKDTNAVDSIVYKGNRYSFDALYKAATGKAIVVKGENKPVISFDYKNITKQADGSYTGSMTITATLPDITTITVEDVVCCNYERYYNGDEEYDEASVDFTAEDKGNGVIEVTFTVPAELADDYKTGSGTSENPEGYTGFDFYYTQDFEGTVLPGQYYSVEDYFEIEG